MICVFLAQVTGNGQLFHPLSHGMFSNFHPVIPVIFVWVSGVNIWSLPQETIILVQLADIELKAFEGASLLITWQLKHHMIHIHFSAATDRCVVSLIFLCYLVECLIDVLMAFTGFAYSKAVDGEFVDSFLASLPHVVHDVKPYLLLESHWTSLPEIQVFFIQLV